MNYVTQTIKNILKERFANDKSYLFEKLEELEMHENKYDGLNYLFSQADSVTIRMYAERTELTVSEIRYLRNIWHKI
jgi:hypothetical protein